MGRLKGTKEAHLDDAEVERIAKSMRKAMPDVVWGGIKADATKLFNQCASKGVLARRCDLFTEGLEGASEATTCART